MLQSLHVKNLALIDEAEVNFENGLNILTGETGAGKSIIIGSVNLALGAKASADLIRKDAPYGLVELVFSVKDKILRKRLNQLEVFPEEDEIIMTRKIMTGRSICRINGETVSASHMRTIASLLIDIHGQHEHQSLLLAKNHLKYVDAYGQADLDGLKKQLSEAFHKYQEKKAELHAASMDEEQQAREISFLQFEVHEIEEACLVSGEDQDLESEYRKLSNSRKIIQAAGLSYEFTGNAVENASDLMGRALRELMSVSEYDPKLEELTGQLQDIDSLLSDFNREISDYLSEADFSDEMFVKVQQRLDLINHLKSKYGDSVEKILEEKEKKEARIEQLLNYENYRKELQTNLENLEEILTELSDTISRIRRKYAKELIAEMTQALQDLNFLDVQFDIRFEKTKNFTEEGTDQVRFFISTNPGEALKPLEQTASGGELSRIMLALKTVLAGNDEIETLIFDEIDSGISGRTAQKVAEKMKMTAKAHQIICITHLPQIASMSDAHFLIEKKARQGTTVSNIRPLDREESILELARMLGGAKITDTVKQSAREMKEMADSVK